MLSFSWTIACCVFPTPEEPSKTRGAFSYSLPLRIPPPVWFFKDFKSFEMSGKRAALVLLSGDEEVLGDEKVLIVEGTTVLNRGKTRENIADDKSCEMENKNDGPRLFFVVGKWFYVVCG